MDIKRTLNAVASKVIPFQLKQPCLFDFYEGEAPLNWLAIDALLPLRLVFQATLGAHGRHGDNKPDREVGNYVTQSRIKQQRYGLYHLLVPGETQKQADFYCQTVDALGGLGDMMPILDVEYAFSGKNSIAGKQWAGQVKLWLDMIEAHFHQKALIYTSKYYWSFLNYYQVITGSKKPILAPPPWTKDYPGWFAGYPWVPYLDRNPSMPKAYQANGFIDWAIWQYNDAGRPRFPANDLNMVSPWFAALLDNPGPVPIYAMDYKRETWGSTYLYTAVVSIPAARFFITPSKTNLVALQKTSDVAKAHNLALCVNGGGFEYVGNVSVSLGRAVSQGHIYGLMLEQSMYISKKNVIYFKARRPMWNAIPFPNRLVSDYIPIHTTREDIAPRTFIGIKDEKMTFAVIEGVEGQRGATINQVIDLCLNMKFQDAILLDGGGSSSFVVDGILRNIPSDDNIPGHERPVCTHFGVY